MYTRVGGSGCVQGSVGVPCNSLISGGFYFVWLQRLAREGRIAPRAVLAGALARLTRTDAASLGFGEQALSLGESGASPVRGPE
jgi:N-acyl-D-aspartate/D-glutamate deacylase